MKDDSWAVIFMMDTIRCRFEDIFFFFWFVVLLVVFWTNTSMHISYNYSYTSHNSCVYCVRLKYLTLRTTKTTRNHV